MSLPFFSIVIATHLRARLLARALASLKAQSFQDFEVIVVADALDADTGQVAAQWLRPHDTFVKRPGPPGPALSRNLGLRLAQGQWLIFLDDDDTFLPHHLEAVFNRARQGDAPVLFTDCDVVTEDRSQADITALSSQNVPLTGQPVRELWLKNFIPNHALAYERRLLCGCEFDATLDSLEDWDFLLAVCTKAMPTAFAGGGVVVHKDYVNPQFRRGAAQSSSHVRVIQDCLHIFRRWPAPTPELKAERQALMAGVGLNLPAEWF